MKYFSVVNLSTNTGSINRWGKDRARASSQRLAIILLFICAGTAGAQSLPLGAQKFTISTGALELALLQVVEQSGHQLIMQGTSKSQNRLCDFIGIDTLPGILSKLLFRSGLEFEILANKIIVVNAKDPFSNGIAISSSSDSRKTDFIDSFENAGLAGSGLCTKSWDSDREPMKIGDDASLIRYFGAQHFANLSSLNEWQSVNDLPDHTVFEHSILRMNLFGVNTDDISLSEYIDRDWKQRSGYMRRANLKLLSDSTSGGGFNEEEGLAEASALLDDFAEAIGCNIRRDNETLDSIGTPRFSEKSVDNFVFTARFYSSHGVGNKSGFVSGIVSQNKLIACEHSMTVGLGLEVELLNDPPNTGFAIYEMRIDDLPIGLERAPSISSMAVQDHHNEAEVVAHSKAGGYDDLFCLHGAEIGGVGL